MRGQRRFVYNRGISTKPLYSVRARNGQTGSISASTIFLMVFPVVKLLKVIDQHAGVWRPILKFLFEQRATWAVRVAEFYSRVREKNDFDVKTKRATMMNFHWVENRNPKNVPYVREHDDIDLAIHWLCVWQTIVIRYFYYSVRFAGNFEIGFFSDHGAVRLQPKHKSISFSDVISNITSQLRVTGIIHFSEKSD